MKQVYSYIRWSSSQQSKGSSYKRQLDYAREFAERFGYVLNETSFMIDEGLSAFHQVHKTKGALGIFLAAIEEGKIPKGSILVVESLDRLSRAQIDQALTQFFAIIRGGVDIHTAMDGRTYTIESLSNIADMVVSLVIMSRAHEESATKSKRAKKFIQSRIDKNEIIPSRYPYWIRHNKETDKLELIPDHVEIIKKILELYSNGYGVSKVTRWLNDNNIKPFSGKTWYMMYIMTVINNVALIGRKIINLDGEEHIIDNYYPRVIEDSEFYALQEHYKSRSKTSAVRQLPTLFTGLRIAYCGYCNSILSAQQGKGKKGTFIDSKRRLRCTHLQNGIECPIGSRTIKISPIEMLILDYCRDQLDLNHLNTDKKNYDTEITATKFKLNEKTGQLDKLLNLFLEMDNPPTNFTQRAEILEEEKHSLKERIKELELLSEIQKNQNNNEVIEQWKEIKESVKNFDVEWRYKVRELVRRSIKRIDIWFFGQDAFGIRSDIKELMSSGFHYSEQEITEFERSRYDNDFVSVRIIFKSGLFRYIKVHKLTGEWLVIGDEDGIQLNNKLQ